MLMREGTARRGWKAADSRKLVAHAIEGMNEWVCTDDVLAGTVEVPLVPDDYDYSAPGFKAAVEDDGGSFRMHMMILMNAELMDVREESEDGNKLV